MRRALFAALALILAVALPASAQEVSGEWELVMDTPQGVQSSVYSFKQEGMTFTGMATLPMGDFEVYDGMVHGTDVTFKVEIAINNQYFELAFAGKLDGETMEGTITNADGMFPPIPWTGKRKQG